MTMLPKDIAGGWRIYIVGVKHDDLQAVLGNELQLAGNRAYVAY